jgi:hypothetical protein
MKVWGLASVTSVAPASILEEFKRMEQAVSSEATSMNMWSYCGLEPLFATGVTP